jgi:hypothetical protein
MLFDAGGCFVHQVFGGETTTFQGTPGRTDAVFCCADHLVARKHRVELAYW